jgi:hypothetical protein
MEEILSTNFLYDRIKKKIIYDGVSLKRLANNPAEKVVYVADVPAALQAAVRLAHESWNNFFWVELFKQ